MAEVNNNVNPTNEGQESVENDFTPIKSREELETYLNEVKEQMKAEYSKSIANERKRYEEKTKKLERDIELSKMTEEERVKQVEADARKQQEDELNTLKSELDNLRLEKRNSEIKSKLLEQKLPNRYMYDVRLTTSQDIDKTIKEFKKEYELEVSDIKKSNIKDTSPSMSTNNPSEKKTNGSTVDDLWALTKASKIRYN